MNLVATSDWHIRLSNPGNRIDDYYRVQRNKVEWILKYCAELGDDTVLAVAGDLFDNANTPKWLIGEYMYLFNKYGVTVVACAGQHDQHFHSLELKNTPIGILYSSGLVQKAWGNITTVDWDEEYVPDDNDVLVIHRCVTEKPNEFIDYSYVPDEMFKKYPDKRFIISGDYHVPHVASKGDRLLINPGSIMRMAKNQFNYKPCIWTLDTQDGEYGKLYIPIEAPEKVFNLDNIDRQEDKDKLEKRFDDMIDSLKEVDNKPEYESNLEIVMEELKPKESVVAEMSTVMEVCNGRRIG